MATARKDMRTPLARVRALGSAKSGTSDHIRQRITAVALVPLSLFFIGFVVMLTGADYATARAWLRSEEHTSELQSRENLVCRLLLEKKNINFSQESKKEGHTIQEYCGTCSGPQDISIQ